jgi:hypothetical protein
MTEISSSMESELQDLTEDILSHPVTPAFDGGPRSSDARSRETQKDLLNWYRRAPVRMPRSRPELFHLLALFTPQTGLNEFIRMIDFTNVTPIQIYQVVLGRPPESVQVTLPYADYDPRDHFRGALLSKEFRENFQASFLNAFPGKGRDVFIHVPKCAGTDLILNLGRRSVPLPRMLAQEGWTTKTEFLEIVGGLARAAISGDRLFAYGHMELGEYIELAGIRPVDRIFTVLRDPIDLMISQANYAVGRIRQDPNGRDPDAAEYLRLLGLTHLPDQISPGDLKDLTVEALLNPLISEPNRASFYLGSGSRTRYAIAMENLIIHNVEITTTTHYDRWLKERWGIEESVRHNRSEPILPNAEARRMCGATLAKQIAEDQKLYDVVSWALCKSGAASVTGQELVRLVGPSLTEALPANAIPHLGSAPKTKPDEARILVAEDAEHVEMYLAPVSVDIPGSDLVETVVSAEMRANTGAEKYLLGGWGLPEERFTWTAAEHCEIQLPPLHGKGYFVLRMVVSPLVVRERLRFQRLDLSIGGTLLGSCRLKDKSVIEVRLPPAEGQDDSPVTIALSLPNATRPSDITDSEDTRLLGLAVHTITVFRVAPIG